MQKAIYLQGYLHYAFHTAEKNFWCQWINSEAGSAIGLELAAEAEGHFVALSALCQAKTFSGVRSAQVLYRAMLAQDHIDTSQSALTKPAAYVCTVLYHPQAQKS